MPHLAELALWAADTALPHLRQVMDADSVSQLLGIGVSRKYIRYKPGFAAIALYQAGNSMVCVETMADEKKLADKSYGSWPKGQLGIGCRMEEGFVVWEFPCDRVLASISSLDLDAIQVLAYKPQRRLTIRQDDRLVKFYTKDDYAVIKGKSKTLRPGGPISIQSRVEKCRALRSVTHEWLEGVALNDESIRDNLHSVGAALASFHKGKGKELPRLTRNDEVASMGAAAEFASCVLPEIRPRVDRLALQLAETLHKRPFKGGPIHGDLAAAQMVVGEQIGFVDVDRAAIGDPAYDIGTLIAKCAFSSSETIRLLDAYIESFMEVPNIALQTACAYLRCLPDSFKSGRADWPEKTIACLQTAEKTLIDAALPELDDALRIPASRLVKHRPGRRAVVRAGDRYVKVRAKGVDNATQEAYEALRKCNFSFSFPKEVRVDKRLRRVELPAVTGIDAESLLFAGDVDVATAVGRALAEFHKSEISVPRRHSVADEIDTLEHRLGSDSAMLSACKAAAKGLTIVSDRPLHRDFHPGQILHSGSGIGIIDFDLLAMGDPAVDVGNFVAHLIDAEIRFDLNLREVILAFENAYQSAGGPALKSNVEIYAALSLARLSDIALERPARRAKAQFIERAAMEALSSTRS